MQKPILKTVLANNIYFQKGKNTFLYTKVKNSTVVVILKGSVDLIGRRLNNAH